MTTDLKRTFTLQRQRAAEMTDIRRGDRVVIYARVVDDPWCMPFGGVPRVRVKIDGAEWTIDVACSAMKKA